jgi:hypothetical protein
VTEGEMMSAERENKERERERGRERKREKETVHLRREKPELTLFCSCPNFDTKRNAFEKSFCIQLMTVFCESVAKQVGVPTVPSAVIMCQFYIGPYQVIHVIS